MRFLRRNALGVYAVYGATIVSGLVVTPITLHALGEDGFGIWAFIGSITLYLTVLDFGLGPSVVRFSAEARGRGAPEDTNRLASVALALYGAIGARHPPARARARLAGAAPDRTPDDLVGERRLATFLVVLSLVVRFPLGLFYNLLGGHQRFDVQNLGNFIATVVYAALVAVLLPRGGGLVLLALLTLAVTLFRLTLPLFWLRREFPGAAPPPRVREPARDPRARLGEHEQLPRPDREQGRVLDRRRRRRDRARRHGNGLLRRSGEAVPARVRPLQRGRDFDVSRPSRSRRARRRRSSSGGSCSSGCGARWLRRSWSRCPCCCFRT